ncbi:MAG: plastocyanin/azurin family copper-binding protein [Rhodocyclaceae bacterium]|nr:plastocyanin/azurin family copper-binding protein [Rhodocyclaceae bacterium]
MRSGATLLGGLGLWLGAALAWAQTVAEVGILNYHYHPHELRVKAGTTVRWVNQEKRTSHSILFLGKDGFESERIFPGERWERRFDAPGRYEYSCGPHPEMKGVVIVE